jgi:protein-L-isoaspartate(D-aspartate) O-methyltransferase
MEPAFAGKTVTFHAHRFAEGLAGIISRDMSQPVMTEDLFESLRAEMMVEVTAEAALTGSHTGKSAFDPRVVDVLGRIPRHEFVPIELQPYAYLNRPLPIGYEKTISQPFIVALMTDLLELNSDDVVLEIGAGAGYQAAVLAELVQQVYSVDIIEELAEGAEKRLRRLGYNNVDVSVANGYYGLSAHAPYDKIMVTAACELIPPPLLTQLKSGGRMVIPTGIPEKQTLTLVEKSAEGRLSTREILPVRFSELEEPAPTAGLA